MMGHVRKKYDFEYGEVIFLPRDSWGESTALFVYVCEGVYSDGNTMYIIF